MRWLVIIFFTATFFFPIKTSAVQGTCSWHGGADCSRFDIDDGSEICKDGWHDSSVYYWDQCLEPCDERAFILISHFTCKALYISGPQYDICYNDMMAQFHAGNCFRQNLQPQNISCAQYGANSYLNPSDQLCYCKEGYQFNQSKTQCIERPCVTNAQKIGEICTCKEGYVMRDDQCITHTEDCRRQFGNNINYGVKSDNDSSICYCKSGYKWNTERTSCILIDIIPTKTSSAVIPPLTFIAPTEASSEIKSNEPKSCSEGFALSLNKKDCIKIPEHAHTVTDSPTDVWLCDAGYEEASNECILIKDEVGQQNEDEVQILSQERAPEQPSPSSVEELVVDDPSEEPRVTSVDNKFGLWSWVKNTFARILSFFRRK